MASMASRVDTSEVLGCTPLAQVAVYPLGATWDFTNVRQGWAAARVTLGRRPDPDLAQTPRIPYTYGSSGAIVAVTSAELALIEFKSQSHRIALTAGQVIVRIPRGDVKSVLLGRGRGLAGGAVVLPLTILLAGDGTWRLEVPRVDKGNAKAVVQALAA
jgi:hypothetical protein